MKNFESTVNLILHMGPSRPVVSFKEPLKINEFILRGVELRPQGTFVEFSYKNSRLVTYATLTDIHKWIGESMEWQFLQKLTDTY